NPDNTSAALPNSFTFTGSVAAALQVTSVSPATGATSGGNIVTITGTGFAAGATVLFGTQAANSVSVVSSTQITAITPPGAAGAVSGTVTSAGLSASLAGGFTYGSGSGTGTGTGTQPGAVTVTSVTP